MSRIRTLVLLVTVAALALLLAACGGDSDSGSSADPQQVIDQATLEGVESGNLDLALKVDSSGEEGGSAEITLAGPFQAGAKGSLPEADLELTARGESEGEQLDFEGGLTLLSDRAFIGYEGEEFEVDPTTFGFVRSGFEQAQQEGGGEGAEAQACQEAAAELDIGSFVDNLTNEGGVDVDGTATTEISGDLNVPGAIDQIIALTENPACSSQLEMAGPLPLGQLEEAKQELGKSVKNAHVAVFVGEEDDIVRKLEAQATIEPEGEGKVEVDFVLTLGGVNEEQTISPPASAKPLEQLFNRLGFNPLELLQGGGLNLEGLLEGIGGGSGDGSGGGEGPSAEIQVPDAKESEAYLRCLQEVESASDLQKCANKAPK